MTARSWAARLQYWLPKNAISAVVYRIARSRRPWVKDSLIRWFARTYRIDLSEAEHTELTHYETFNQFFTRALAPGARPILGDALTVTSPADGVLTEFGAIDDDRLLQAKGSSYTLAELLGEDGPETAALRGGTYASVYLAPHDYHRVHLPLAAALRRTRYMRGARFAVNRATVAVVPRLFCRNERAACWFDTVAGPVVVVLVGALNVSSISTFNLGEIRSGQARHWIESTPIPLTRGAEIARFNLGSTVIMLFGPDAVHWDSQMRSGTTVKVGLPLGRILGAEELRR